MKGVYKLWSWGVLKERSLGVTNGGPHPHSHSHSLHRKLQSALAS